MKIPRIKVEYLDVYSIIRKHQQHIEIMKQLFGHHAPLGTVFNSKDEILKSREHLLPDDNNFVVVPSLKYTKDIFYLAPFYHLELVNIDKLVVLDADLQFRYLH